MGCSWFNTETNKRKTSINNKKTWIKYIDKKSRYKTQISSQKFTNLQLQHSNSITCTYVCNYKVQFCAFKGGSQNLPLRRVGRGEISPPSSSQRLTGMPLYSPRFLCRLMALIKLLVAVQRQSVLYTENSGFVLQLWVSTFPRFVAIGFYFLS